MTQDNEIPATTWINGRQIAAVFHGAPGKNLVIFCHGFRSSKIGPNRLFVRLARELQQAGVSSLRFDQFGSGDSDGDFFESSFNDWVATTITLTERYLDEGYHVSLLGQSMGGSTALVAAARLGKRLSSVVAWVPDPSVDTLEPEGDYHEEGGQRVSWTFWREAHNADIPGHFQHIEAHTLVFFATDDAYVSEENRQSLITVRQPHQRIETLDGHSHSTWTFVQAENVLAQTREFLVAHFPGTPTA